MDSIPPELIVASIVVLGGVVGLALMRRWLTRNLGENGYKSMSIFSQTSVSKHGKADPLSEAEVYLAYGRKIQALEVLEKALHDSPNRTDIAAKIRELKRLQ